MIPVKVQTNGGRVKLQRTYQSFVFPIDEAPALVQELLAAIRRRTVEEQRAAQEETKGETEHV